MMHRKTAAQNQFFFMSTKASMERPKIAINSAAIRAGCKCGATINCPVLLHNERLRQTEGFFSVHPDLAYLRGVAT